jgi:predicted nucleic acid-binding protein
MVIRKDLVYWDSCIFIAIINNEKRPNNEMDGVYDCIDKIEKGQIRMMILRDLLFEEVELRTLEAAQKLRMIMKRGGIELPSKDVRIERLAKELCDYYDNHGPKPMGEKDALHLATAIHYRANAFYTFDSGGKRNNISLLSMNGNVAGIYPLLICKPPVTQWRLFKP